MALVKTSSILLLLFAVLTLALAAPGQSQEQGNGRLRVLSFSAQKLHAIYHTAAGADEGLQVLSEDNSQDKYVTISTLDGEELISAQFSSSETSVLWKILGYSFFLHKEGIYGGRTRTDAYVVPSSQVRLMKKGMKRNRFTSKLLRTLDTEHANETKETAFLELFSHPALNVIFEMSRALGEAGVTGGDNQAALNFHGLALHYYKLGQGRPEFNPRQEKEEEAEEGEGSGREPGQIEKRSYMECLWPGSSSYSFGSSCTGLCGIGCDCWSWVCGDCCNHHYGICHFECYDYYRDRKSVV